MHSFTRWSSTVLWLAAGELVYAQFWSRDPQASFTTNRSNAVRFGIAQ